MKLFKEMTVSFLSILVLSALALIPLASCSPARPKLEAQCMHPAIFGGTPFTLPSPYKFNDNGSLTVTIQGTQITLHGAICVSYAVKNN